MTDNKEVIVNVKVDTEIEHKKYISIFDRFKNIINNKIFKYIISGICGTILAILIIISIIALILLVITILYYTGYYFPIGIPDPNNDDIIINIFVGFLDWILLILSIIVIGFIIGFIVSIFICTCNCIYAIISSCNINNND